MAKLDQPVPGLYFDELSKIRVLESEASAQNNELKEECQDFVEKIEEFQRGISDFSEILDKLAKQVEHEKMKAVGARNKLQSIAKERDSLKQQLQSMISEKKMELERLRIQYHSLIQVERDQQELIDNFTLQR